MNIQQAAKKAVAADAFIARSWWMGHFQVKPTNQPECCIAYAKGQLPRPRWEPSAEDLLADDWEVTTEELI